MELTQTKYRNEERIKKSENAVRDLWVLSNRIVFTLYRSQRKTERSRKKNLKKYWLKINL